MTKRVPQHFIDYGIWYANGRSVEGMPFPFDSSRRLPTSPIGDEWLHWRGRLGETLIQVIVTGVNLKRTVANYAFAHSEAFMSRLAPGRYLPFAGAQVDKRGGRVWWMATFDDGPITLEVKSITGLTQRQLEDAFNNSTARVEARPLSYGRVPAKEDKMKSIERRPGESVEDFQWRKIMEQHEREPKELPKFKGYTVDYRLRQFRKAEPGKTLVFIDFDSADGELLLRDMAAAETGIQPGEWGVIKPDWGYHVEFRSNLTGAWYRASAPVRVKVLQYRLNNMADHVLVEYEDGKRGRADIRSLEPRSGGKRVPQTEPVCPICGGPGMSMGVLGNKHWFRCRHCGMEWSIDAKRGTRLPSINLYATLARQTMDDLEKYWKAGNTDEFYRLLDRVKKAIKERERGVIKLLPDISLSELRDIKAQADRLYR